MDRRLFDILGETYINQLKYESKLSEALGSAGICFEMARPTPLCKAVEDLLADVSDDIDIIFELGEIAEWGVTIINDKSAYSADDLWLIANGDK